MEVTIDELIESLKEAEDNARKILSRKVVWEDKEGQT
jgi:hypothetical protein